MFEKCEQKKSSINMNFVKCRGCISPSKFLPLGNGEKWGGKFFSHGEMGKNGESYFGFELTKNGTKSTLFEFRAFF